MRPRSGRDGREEDERAGRAQKRERVERSRIQMARASRKSVLLHLDVSSARGGAQFALREGRRQGTDLGEPFLRGAGLPLGRLSTSTRARALGHPCRTTARSSDPLRSFRVRRAKGPSSWRSEQAGATLASRPIYVSALGERRPALTRPLMRPAQPDQGQSPRLTLLDKALELALAEHLRLLDARDALSLHAVQAGGERGCQRRGATRKGEGSGDARPRTRAASGCTSGCTAARGTASWATATRGTSRRTVCGRLSIEGQGREVQSGRVQGARAGEEPRADDPRRTGRTGLALALEGLLDEWHDVDTVLCVGSRARHRKAVSAKRSNRQERGGRTGHHMRLVPGAKLDRNSRYDRLPLVELIWTASVCIL